MRAPLKTVLFATSMLTMAACSGPAEEDATETYGAEADAPAEGTDQSAQSEPESEAYEVCDGDGNRYPSAADAEAAGLELAEYGATYCDYIEEPAN